MKPLYDYSFFLCVASFDFLLLDAFKHTNPFGDGLYSIFMVVIGSLFTVSIGVFCFPQFAGAPTGQILQVGPNVGIGRVRNVCRFLLQLLALS